MQVFDLESLLKDGWPAFLVMLGCVAILAFLRLVVPRLIVRWQKKKPLKR